MPYRCCAWLVVAGIALAQVPLASQEPPPAGGGWTVPRTPDGHPDLQGIWANDSATPLERPQGFEGTPVLTDEEFAALKQRADELTSESSDAGFVDEVFRAVTAGADESRRRVPEPETTTISGSPSGSSKTARRSSLIPPTGGFRFYLRYSRKCRNWPDGTRAPNRPLPGQTSVC